MAKHILLAFTNPVEGKEAAFNHWYSTRHMKEVTEVPGFISTQRFELAPTQLYSMESQYRYLAVYEIETDDLEGTTEALRQARARMHISDTLDPNFGVWTFSAITEQLSVPAK